MATTATARTRPSKEETLVEFKLAFREYLTRSHVAAENEMDSLMHLLEQPLPVCFRLNLDGLESERLKALFSSKLQFPLRTYFHNNVAITPPQYISCPVPLAISLVTTRW
ncbi:hypothetical protein DYB37_005732 [Aphanomyces astaci]|uniref:Uncharacterized protein n=1 Tax=Aphanomyces astaci TaxID=112090 RepID=A0A3R7C8W1_APHAT|nr:hypothetical protein DYB35_009570 [Aphanomyces astaci]RHZ18739.1 hypothetical protein DYB37_005732 [Aphanomyces astaci]